MASKQFVSRGGEKLQSALDQFKISVKDKVILDVGSSTGGFVDCLLQNEAKKVYALDTAYGELAWKLRNDQRVVVMERTNILHLENLPEMAEGPERSRRVDIITIDAGWTRLELILPVVRKFLKPDGIIVALLKPHYEAEKKDLIKGVLPAEKAEEVKNNVIKTISDIQYTTNDCMESPILGGGGNKEYLLIITV
ncbi:TlyA family rRNA (cytidine-2'-O)-methyltransferase [Candidatus Daviesbacteria bacterium]|nr:TlyA family rRNA (cytidine-2'-O)-methyltransferase [Candidatus Daviesbacteria bacterium]